MASRNRAVAAVFMALIILLILSGVLTSYDTLARLPVYVRAAILVFTPLTAIFALLIMIPKRWTAPGSIVVGILQVAQPVLIVSSGVPQQLQVGGLIHAILAIVVVYFSYRAYAEMPFK
jgi:hypothetical protein